VDSRIRGGRSQEGQGRLVGLSRGRVDVIAEWAIRRRSLVWRLEF
jgi:hypothetical protein